MVFGYMCKIAWQHEICEALGGVKIYSTIEDLKENHAPWKECGIVRVRVEFDETIVEQDLLKEENEV